MQNCRVSRKIIATGKLAMSRSTLMLLLLCTLFEDFQEDYRQAVKPSYFLLLMICDEVANPRFQKQKVL